MSGFGFVSPRSKKRSTDGQAMGSGHWNLPSMYESLRMQTIVEPVSALRHPVIGGIQDPSLDVIAIQSQQLV